MATEAIEVTKAKILKYALNSGFYLISYAGATVEGLSFKTDYNRLHSPIISDKKLITDVLKDHGLIRWDASVCGWHIPENVDEIINKLKEKAA